MRRVQLLVTTTAVVSLWWAVIFGAAAAEVPLRTQFVDSGMSIRSDVRGAYSDGVDCVRSWFNSQKGNFFLRTVSQTAGSCRDTGGVPGGDPDAARRLVLDFSSWLGAQPACEMSDGRGNVLDACGSNAVIDVRVIATEAYKTGATSTPVTLQFDLYPNFSEGAAFELRFVNRVPVTTAGTTRTLVATGTEAAAQLSRRDPNRPARLIVVGQYAMPFQATLTPQ